MTKRSDMLTANTRAVCLAAILDQKQIVALGNSTQFVHWKRPTV
jgi:hypothetical protein